MYIGIDARGLDGNRSGIPTYIEEIVKNISELDNQKNKYILYSSRAININAKLNDNIIIKDDNKRLGSLWVYFKLPKILQEDKIDVYWGTQHCLPKRNKYTKNIKFVLTIHDLAIKKLKTVGSFKNTIIQKLFLKKSLKNSDKIIADSEATKKDIIDLYNIDEKKINVIYPGSNLKKNDLEITEKQKNMLDEKFKIKDINYLFFISTIEPRKNIETLIRAFEYIKKREKSNLKLILAGGLGWKYQSVLDLLDKSEFKEDIIMPGYISNDEKEYLFENAKCFVYPSLYEGFGLPILEAMVNKCLVVTSNISSIPEVGGDAAFYYNSVLDYEELGNKIIEVINLNDGEKRERIEKGLKQTKKFTWEKCAKEIMAVIGG